MSKKNKGKKKSLHQYGFKTGKHVRRHAWAWDKKVKQGKVGRRTSQ